MKTPDYSEGFLAHISANDDKPHAYQDGDAQFFKFEYFDATDLESGTKTGYLKNLGDTSALSKLADTKVVLLETTKSYSLDGQDVSATFIDMSLDRVRFLNKEETLVPLRALQRRPELTLG